jgi:DNA-binding IscR family transcriptional regulator
MEEQKLTSDRADAIITLLRENPGVSMTIGDISDATNIPVEELAAHLTELSGKGVIDSETTADGFDVYRFPDEQRRGTMIPLP